MSNAGSRKITPDDMWFEILDRIIALEANLPPGAEDGSYHPMTKCAGWYCPFHDPSDHHMVEWPKVIRASALTERICPHGVGHPDPDSLVWMRNMGVEGYEIHGCDGCCAPPEKEEDGTTS